VPTPNPAALDFLLTRRSRPAKTLDAPHPSDAELEPLLTAAARTPDHGKLEPWRFIVLREPALKRMAEAVPACGTHLGKDDDQIQKMAKQFGDGHLAVAVIESPKASEKIPAIEQTYSAGAVCLALLNAALSAGWGANWLSGWASHDPTFVQAEMGLANHERVAGLVFLGTERMAPPERPRPNTTDITTWIDT